MKKKYADLWAQALRSGDYKQSYRRLASPEGFCCLGVLSDVVGPELGIKWTIDHEGNQRFGLERLVLTEEVLELTGIRVDEVSIEETDAWWNGSLPKTLVGLNDNEKWDFSEIADFVEDNYKNL